LQYRWKIYRYRHNFGYLDRDRLLGKRTIPHRFAASNNSIANRALPA
jgi:hypothetical protein